MSCAPNVRLTFDAPKMEKYPRDDRFVESVTRWDKWDIQRGFQLPIGFLSRACMRKLKLVSCAPNVRLTFDAPKMEKYPRDDRFCKGGTKWDKWDIQNTPQIPQITLIHTSPALELPVVPPQRQTAGSRQEGAPKIDQITIANR